VCGAMSAPFVLICKVVLVWAVIQLCSMLLLILPFISQLTLCCLVETAAQLLNGSVSFVKC